LIYATALAAIIVIPHASWAGSPDFRGRPATSCCWRPGPGTTGSYSGYGDLAAGLRHGAFLTPLVDGILSAAAAVAIRRNPRCCRNSVMLGLLALFGSRHRVRVDNFPIRRGLQAISA